MVKLVESMLYVWLWLHIPLMADTARNMDAELAIDPQSTHPHPVPILSLTLPQHYDASIFAQPV